MRHLRRRARHRRGGPPSGRPERPCRRPPPPWRPRPRRAWRRGRRPWPPPRPADASPPRRACRRGRRVLDERRGGHEVPVEAERLGRQAEGEAHDLRDEEDRQRLLAACRHRLLAQVEVAVAERAGDDDRLRAVAPCVLDDGAAEPHDGAGAADAEGAAAALDLHVPVDGLGAAGADDVVHLGRLLRVVAAAELRRTNEQAAVVGGELDALERVGLARRRRRLLLEGRRRIVQKLHRIEDLDAVREGAAEDLGHPLCKTILGRDREMRSGEAAVAGGAGRQYTVEALRLGEGQVAGRQRHAEQVVGGVAAACAAAVPVGDLGEPDAELGDDGAQALVELRRGAVQRAAGIVGDAASGLRPRGVLRAQGRRVLGQRAHGVTPHCSKMRLTSATPSILSASRWSLPRVSMPGALVTSFMRSPVLSL